MIGKYVNKCLKDQKAKIKINIFQCLLWPIHYYNLFKYITNSSNPNDNPIR